MYPGVRCILCLVLFQILHMQFRYKLEPGLHFLWTHSFYPMLTGSPLLHMKRENLIGYVLSFQKISYYNALMIIYCKFYSHAIELYISTRATCMNTYFLQPMLPGNPPWWIKRENLIRYVLSFQKFSYYKLTKSPVLPIRGQPTL